MMTEIQELIWKLEQMQQIVDDIKEYDHDLYGGYAYSDFEVIQKFVENTIKSGESND